jgi:dihydroneopterin triphosphate diphosphatase
VSGVRVAFIDLYVLRQAARKKLEFLALRRGKADRCPGAWETVHGKIEGNETPVAAALRELREETGLVPVRLYNVSRVESFYLHRTNEVALLPVFAAFVERDAAVRTSSEHDAAQWLSARDALRRFAWPRERRAVMDIVSLLVKGDGGLLEDVLRVC